MQNSTVVNRIPYKTTPEKIPLPALTFYRQMFPSTISFCFLFSRSDTFSTMT